MKGCKVGIYDEIWQMRRNNLQIDVILFFFKGSLLFIVKQRLYLEEK